MGLGIASTAQRAPGGTPSFGLRVSGLGITLPPRHPGFGFRILGLGITHGVGCMVQFEDPAGRRWFTSTAECSHTLPPGFGSRVVGLGMRVYGVWCMVVLRLRVSGSGFRVSVFGFRASG